MTKQPLLTEYNLNGLKLPNRVVMAPMTRSRADNPENAPREDFEAAYYALRASAGLIITEGSPISDDAIGYVNVPGIYKQAQVEGWKKVTKKVHDENGRIFIQLWHVGRMSHPDFHNGEKPLAPSAINPNAQSYTPEGFKDTVTPQEMTIEDIKKTIEDFKNGAKNAMEAGFDGIEIHSSNGYLLHQFFNATSNTRSDEYGGSIENRAKILFEVIDAIKEYDMCVLAAGGIVTGRQMAACMAMGAHGAWTGSVWLTTAEAETLPIVKEKMLVANSRQTVRSKSRTGKYTRQLRSAWTDAWTAEECPEPLPMPLQGVVAAAAFRKIDKLAQTDHAGARQLANYFVGQGVGLMNETIAVRTVVYNFMEDFAEATERLAQTVAD